MPWMHMCEYTRDVSIMLERRNASWLAAICWVLIVGLRAGRRAITADILFTRVANPDSIADCATLIFAHNDNNPTAFPSVD